MKRNYTRNSGRFAGLAAGTLAAGLTLGAAATTYHVDGAMGHDTNNNGQSWAAPFKTVQKALNAVGSGDIIFVAAGTYYPDEIDGGDSDDRDDSFDLVNDVSVYGGFLNGDDFEDRDPENNITILSGDIDQDYDYTDPFGDNDSNSYHVVTANDVGNGTILNGFTITGANADSTDPPGRGRGGGMNCVDSIPIIVRCVFFENSAGSDTFGGGGGGLRISGAPAGETFAFVINCSFIDNRAVGLSGPISTGGRGGGLVTGNSRLNIINCLFDSNETTGSAVPKFLLDLSSHDPIIGYIKKHQAY